MNMNVNVNMNRHTIKCVIVGDSCVGKTSILASYLRDIFDTDVNNTIGASFWETTIKIDSKNCHISFWDTAGQERFRAMTPLYYRNSKAAIIVFDASLYLLFCFKYCQASPLFISSSVHCPYARL